MAINALISLDNRQKIFFHNISSTYFLKNINNLQIVFSALLAMALAMPEPEAAPEAEAAPDADAAAHYYGYYGWGWPYRYHYGYPYYYGHYAHHWWGKRSAEEEPELLRHRRSADALPAPRPAPRNGLSGPAPGPDASPEAAPKADADAAAWYYAHYGYYPYHYYGYPYHYGHYWYGKRSAEEPEEQRHRRSADYDYVDYVDQQNVAKRSADPAPAPNASPDAAPEADADPAAWYYAYYGHYPYYSYGYHYPYYWYGRR